MKGLLRRGVARTGAPPPAAHRSGWSALLLPRTDPPRRFTRDGEADAVVIGAGFTGLAAARRLAELRPGWRVLLLEASRAGSGATGRSSGFLVDVTFFTTTLDEASAERYVRLSRAGIEALRKRALEDGIACDWDDTGWIHAAAGEPGLADLATLRRWLDDRGEPYTWLDAPELAGVLGTPFYRAGIRLPGRPLVQPSALARGLAAGLPGGVELYEGSPVRRMEASRSRGRRGSSTWRLAVGDATLTAPRVLLATNGYTPTLGFLGGRVFPLLTFGSLTRPLTPAEAAGVGGEPRWGVLAQDPMGSSLRRTGDGRLLVRNTVAFSRSLDARPAELDRAREAHRDALARRFPDLFPSPGAVELEHTWTGVMGATPSRRFFFGRVAEGLWATAGFTGAGIAQGTIAGALLADLACGEDSEWLRDLLALPAPGRLPPRPFQDLGIRWRVARMNAGAGETL